MYVWSVSYPSSQPHSYGIIYLIGDGPISGGQDTIRSQTTPKRLGGSVTAVEMNTLNNVQLKKFNFLESFLTRKYDRDDFGSAITNPETRVIVH